MPRSVGVQQADIKVWVPPQREPVGTLRLRDWQGATAPPWGAVPSAPWKRVWRYLFEAERVLAWALVWPALPSERESWPVGL